MVDRCDHYRALRLFAPFWVRCIDGEGSLAVKAGHRCQVVGEIMSIFERPLSPDDEQWILADTHDIPLLYQRKSRFIAESEWIGWRFASISKRIDELRAELDAMEMPDGRF